MDFFEHQRIARRNSFWLIVLFLLAVAAIVAAVGAFFGFAWMLWSNPFSYERTDPWRVAYLAGGFALIAIAAGSLYKTRVLSGGGEVVAADLGGKPVDPGTTDLKRRQLLNVVEEMAIASGTASPRVFVLEGERGINAFAAGLGPGDAVIGVTRGSIELLSRDELQAVVAHEFSHVLNGDMRLNVRMIGLLHGILMLSVLGKKMVQGLGRSSRSSDRDTGGIAVAGVAIYAIGSIGVLFGRLIKSATSRQRELLADAAAVQFTRNAPALVDALKKIGGLATGSILESGAAEEASHMFFNEGVANFWANWFDTHPPLVARIRRLDPMFDGRFPRVDPPPGPEVTRVPLPDSERLAPLAALAGSTPSPAAPNPAPIRLEPGAAALLVGQPGVEHLRYAAAYREGLDERLTRALRDPCGAAAVLYAVLLDERTPVRDRQLEILRGQAEAHVFAELQVILPIVDRAAAQGRLPLVDLALPTLRLVSDRQYKTLRHNVRMLVEADEEISLFELALHRVLLRHLDGHFLKARPPVYQYYSLAQLGRECSILLSSLAHVGHPDSAAARGAFEAAAAGLRVSRAALALLPRESCTVPAVNDTLGRLVTIVPRLRKDLLQACVAAVSHDGQVTVGEGELLRAIADCLDCPIPPLLATP